MRQNPRVESPSQSAPAIALHPLLSDALAHLDIQLEDELARYRRQRVGNGRVVRQSGRQRSSNSLDLIAVSATTAGHDTVAPLTPALEERLADVAEPSSEPHTYKPIPAFTASPQPFEGAIALRALPQDGHADSTQSGEENAYALAQAANPNLDDYLESSEELLRSLADEQAEVQAEHNFMRSLLTPLGMGAMLLLLLSSAMFGYVIMNPSTLPWLTAKQNNNAPGSPPGNGAGSTAIAPQPDLAKRELPDLNLNNLGTVNVNPGKVPATTPSTPAAAPTPSSKPTVAASTAAVSTTTPSQPSREPAASSEAPIPAATSSSSRSYARPEVPQAAPRYVPAPAPVAPPVRRVPTLPPAAVSSQSQNGGGGSGSSYQYKVGIPFENDQTLEAARKVVPDAFVRTLPDGRTIVQVGAARDEAEGRANVQKLRDQGLSSTEVYKR